MTHTAYTHMKSYQGQTGAADPVRLFSIVCGDEYFSVGTYSTLKDREDRFFAEFRLRDHLMRETAITVHQCFISCH